MFFLWWKLNIFSLLRWLVAFLILVATFYLAVFFSAQNNSGSAWVTKVTRGNTSFQYKLNQPSFSAYEWCHWQWKTSLTIGLWVQECTLKWKQVTISPQDKTDLYYYALKKWGKYVAEELAIQSFDFNWNSTPDEIMDSLYSQFISTGVLKVSDLCYFQKDTISGITDWPIFRLVSKKDVNNSNTWSFCWDYWASSLRNKYFMITKKGEISKAVFVNQMQKNIFDVQSLQILS